MPPKRLDPKGRSRVAQACVRCRQRKIRCANDGTTPCYKCVEVYGEDKATNGENKCIYIAVPAEENLANREKKAKAKQAKANLIVNTPVSTTPIPYEYYEGAHRHQRIHHRRTVSFPYPQQELFYPEPLPYQLQQPTPPYENVKLPRVSMPRPQHRSTHSDSFMPSYYGSHHTHSASSSAEHLPHQTPEMYSGYSLNSTPHYQHSAVLPPSARLQISTPVEDNQMSPFPPSPIHETPTRPSHMLNPHGHGMDSTLLPPFYPYNYSVPQTATAAGPSNNSNFESFGYESSAQPSTSQPLIGLGFEDVDYPSTFNLDSGSMYTLSTSSSQELEVEQNASGYWA